MSRIVKCDKCYNQIPTEFINLKERIEGIGEEQIKVLTFSCPACKYEFICSVIDKSIMDMQQEKIAIMDEYLDAVSKEEEAEVQEIAERYRLKKEEQDKYAEELKSEYRNRGCE